MSRDQATPPSVPLFVYKHRATKNKNKKENSKKKLSYRNELSYDQHVSPKEHFPECIFFMYNKRHTSALNTALG